MMRKASSLLCFKSKEEALNNGKNNSLFFLKRFFLNQLDFCDRVVATL